MASEYSEQNPAGAADPKRGYPASHSIRTWRRQVRVGLMDYYLVYLNDEGYPRCGYSQHRDTVKNKNVGGAGQVVQNVSRETSVQTDSDSDLFSYAGTRKNLAD